MILFQAFAFYEASNAEEEVLKIYKN